MKDILTEGFITENGHPDVIITDPPRAGMDARVVEVILAAAPERIVYVSCNPATQARDLQLMQHQYAVKEVHPVDMFPHTASCRECSAAGKNLNKPSIDRYFSPLSYTNVSIVDPLGISGSFLATAANEAPEDIPTKSPSSRAARLV